MLGKFCKLLCWQLVRKLVFYVLTKAFSGILAKVESANVEVNMEREV